MRKRAFVVHLYEVQSNRWVSYFKSAKLILNQIENQWCASLTCGEESIYQSGFKRKQDPILAVVALLSEYGLAFHVGYGKTMRDTFFDCFPKIKFCWHGEHRRRTELFTFITERIDLCFNQQVDNSWLCKWQENTIRLSAIRGGWKFEQVLSGKEHLHIKHLKIMSTDREEAFRRFITDQDSGMILGYDYHLPVSKLAKVIKREWNDLHGSSIVSESNYKIKNNRHQFHGPGQCANYGTCPYCSDFGSNYDVRYDD